MSLAARIALALLCWTGAAVVGWWWYLPRDAVPTAAAAATAGDVAVHGAAPLPLASASRIAAADPMGLNRASTEVPGGAAAAAPASDGVVWQLAALVVRGGERYAVMTATGAQPLSLRPGESLPDGDRINAIHANRIDVQSPRGRLRTLYLIEP